MSALQEDVEAQAKGEGGVEVPEVPVEEVPEPDFDPEKGWDSNG